MKEATAFAAYTEAAACDCAEAKGATLEARAIECLAELDHAREGLRDVLLSLARQRHPLGSLVDLDRVSVIVGDAHGAKRARVRVHHTPEVDLSRPELTGIVLECVTVRRDGVESDNVVLVKTYLLNQAAGPQDRRKLIELVHAVEHPDTMRTRAA